MWLLQTSKKKPKEKSEKQKKWLANDIPKE